MKAKTLYAALLLAAFSATAGAADLFNVLDNVSKAIDTIQDAGVKDVQASTGFDGTAPTGIASVFPTGTKIICVSYVASGGSTSLPILAYWYQSKDGQYSRFYTMKDTMPRSGSTGKFQLSNQAGAWPVGDYRVDLIVQSKVAGSVSFSVSETQSSGNSGAWGTSTASSSTATTSAAASVTPGLKDIIISTGYSSGKAVGAATSFPQGVKTIYVSYTPVGLSSGAKVQSVWYQEKANTLVKISTLNSTYPSSNEFHLACSGDSWPAGSYKVELLVNGAVAITVSFTVENSNSGVWQAN